MRKASYIFTSILTVTIFFSNCKDSVVDPVSIKDISEYVWTLDTIETSGRTPFQLHMSSIWGSSEKILYVCGHNSGGPNLFHYDGNKWRALDLHKDWSISQSIKNYVLGFGENDVWVAGAQGYSGIYEKPVISHFNGNEWEAKEFDIKGSLDFMWGENSNLFWACGKNGVVVHKNNNEWEIDTIKVNRNENDTYIISNIYEINNSLFAFGYHVKNNGLETTYYHYEKVNRTWGVLDSFTIGKSNREYKWGNNGITYYKGQLYSYGTNGLYKYYNNKWENIIVSESIIRLLFLSNSQMLFTTHGGHVYYLNENSTEEIDELHINDIYLYTDIFNIDENIFIIGWISFNTHSSSIVWHGK
jgi:hypothetical protein